MTGKLPCCYLFIFIELRERMNFFDLCILIIVGFCLVRGGFRGLVREISGIVGVVAGFYGANSYYLQLIVYVDSWISSPQLQKLVCFFLLFCLILIAVGIVAALIHKLLKIVFLGAVNRAFGVIFGAAKGILIATVLFITITSFVPNGSNHIATSRTAPYLAQVADALTLFISQNIKMDFNKELEGLRKTWKQ